MKVLNHATERYIAIGYPEDPNKPVDWPWNFTSHNPNGPAFIRFDLVHDNKTNKPKRYKSAELYRIHGDMHREDGPARIEYNSQGLIREEQWFQKGRLHNEFGPARKSYRKGELQNTKFYLKGTQYNELHLDRFIDDWGLDSLADLEHNKAAHAAFIMEFY